MQNPTLSSELLTQVAAPFEMARRGWRDIAGQLHVANEALEQRVAEGRASRASCSMSSLRKQGPITAGAAIFEELQWLPLNQYILVVMVPARA